MKLDEVMMAFGAEIGVSDLAMDADGVYHVAIDDYPVSVMEVAESEQVVIWSRLGDLPSEGLEDFCRQMLEEMSPAGEADGSVFSIEHESNALYLHRTEDVRLLDLAAFEAVLEKFADLLQKWRARQVEFRPQVEAVADISGFVQV